MFNLSGSEIVVILLLALIVLGPDKLPEAMRRAGKTWAELRKLSSGFQDEVRKGFDEPTAEVRQTASAIKKAATLPKNPVKGAVKSLLDPPKASTGTSASAPIETGEAPAVDAASTVDVAPAVDAASTVEDASPVEDAPAADAASTTVEAPAVDAAPPADPDPAPAAEETPATLDEPAPAETPPDDATEPLGERGDPPATDDRADATP